MPISDNQTKSEKRIVSLVVNPQFSKSIGELVLELDVHHYFSEFSGDFENRKSDTL